MWKVLASIVLGVVEVFLVNELLKLIELGLDKYIIEGGFLCIAIVGIPFIIIKLRKI